MAERAPGLYWVRENVAPDEWAIALLTARGWWNLIGSDLSFSEEAFAEIAERAERGSRGLLPVEIAGWPEGIASYDLSKPAAQIPDFVFPAALWPEPQPITDAQKNGKPFMVWICSEHLSPGAAGWYTAFWDARIDAWCVLTPFFHTQGIYADRVTRYIPLPPDVKS